MKAMIDAARLAFRAQAGVRRERERQLESALKSLNAISLAAADTLQDLQGLLAASVDWPAERINRTLAVVVSSYQERLEDSNVVLDGSAGETFDSGRHQIVGRKPSDMVPSEVVLEVVRKGVTCCGRRLSAAGVVLSAGGPDGSADRH